MALSDSAGIGSALPSQVGQSGNYLTTDGTVASWAAVSGGSGFDTLGSFDTTPNTKGLSSSGTTLSLAAADATHPGAVTASAQSLGGVKTFGDGIKSDVTGTATGATNHYLGNVSGFAGLWLGGNADTPAFTGASMLYISGSGTFLNAPNGEDIRIRINNVDVGKINVHGLDLSQTGADVGASIKLKSPDGTVYTATIANGGTWSIA